MKREPPPEFRGLRGLIWPIGRQEIKKLIPMLLIFFFTSFNYHILRTLKDTLVVTAKGSGAEAIPFIKMWAMFPGAILMTILYTRLSNWFSKERVIYLMLSLFLGYFALFAGVLFPARDSLALHRLADYLQSALPAGSMGFVAMIRNWVLTSFYVMAELWSNIVFFLLIWGFANQVTRLSEARRFYAIFGFGAHLSGIFAGLISVSIGKLSYRPELPFGTDGWEQATTILIGLVLLCGLFLLALFRYLTHYVLTDPRYANRGTTKKEEKPKLSFRQSLLYLFRSRYILYLAVIVLSYNIVINLVEVIWKSQMRELYPDPADYHCYFNQVGIIIGLVATFSALFISGNSVRRRGWRFTALITPIIFLVTSSLFFLLFFMRQPLEKTILTTFGVTPLTLLVFVGSAQNILSRSAKYTVFDETKEIAFIPLSRAEKLKGKAAIDGICNRLGKSGGSLIHQTLLLFFASFSASAPWVALILFAIIGVWIAATHRLSDEFDQRTSGEEAPKVEPIALGAAGQGAA